MKVDSKFGVFKNMDIKMSFEKQKCKKCGAFTMCYEHKPNHFYCDYCYSWIIDDAGLKDSVRAIMIECGIEDLESV